MRVAFAAGVIWITGLLLLAAPLGGCTPEPIGQPCTFNWPDTEGPGGELVIDCAEYPRCAPLQNTSRAMDDEPRNDNCPADCVQMPSLECTNLICVATQVEANAEVDGQLVDRAQLMNGQCSADVSRSECLGEGGAAFGCMGYCSKECLSDASCPKGYRCVRMAPYQENLRCEDEKLWGGDVDDPDTEATRCTVDCLPAGADLGDGKKCPGSIEGDPDHAYDYSLCSVKRYSQCCACICYRFCPLLSKKFCRRVEWDREQFPKGLIPVETKDCSERT